MLIGSIGVSSDDHYAMQMLVQLHITRTGIHSSVKINALQGDEGAYIDWRDHITSNDGGASHA